MPTATESKRKPRDVKHSDDEKIIRNIPASIMVVLVAIISVFILAYSIYNYVNAVEIGNEIGSTAGKAAGRLRGSIDGVTDGLEEGAHKGKEDGLSAKDTEVKIGNKIKTIGKLEVLSASVVMHDLLEISDEYKTLLAFYGKITFTIDLYDSEITEDNGIYEVVLPIPEGTLRIDDEKSKQLTSDMKHSWTGNSEDGYTAAMNSIKELTLNAEKSVSNYDLLKSSARESAEKQVSFLIQSATKEEVVIHVSFKDDIKQES